VIWIKGIVTVKYNLMKFTQLLLLAGVAAFVHAHDTTQENSLHVAGV